MRFSLISALLVAVAVAVPHGGAKKEMQQPATTSMPTAMSMPMKKDMEHPVTSSTSMSVPMKRETSTAHATPTSSMRIENPMKAEKMMMLF